MKKTEVQKAAENLNTKASTMEKKPKEDKKHWTNLKSPFRTDQLLDVFQELFQLYAIEAELSRRERELSQERDVDQLQKKVEELENTLKDIEKMRDGVAVGKELKQKQKEMKANENKSNKTNKTDEDKN